jgi:hypothetical protein
VRRAWLTLGSLSVPVEGPGYYCTKLDLGSPVVREVVDHKASSHGEVDRTRYLGGRTVEVNIEALSTAGARIDAVATQFAPFMDPAQRPQLHYVLDRPGAGERVLTLRAANHNWPIVGPYQRSIQLQWLAADPIAKDPVVKSVSAWAGQPAGLAGRNYPLTFPRTYPAGGASSTVGNLVNNGDFNAVPVVVIYGPGSTFTMTLGASVFYFQPGLVLTAGQTITIDPNTHAVYLNGDPTQNGLQYVDWTRTQPVWPYIVPVAQSPGGTGVPLILTASGAASPSTQAIATWQDAYLS